MQMEKFNKKDHSTYRASKEEKDRIFQSFVKRVEDFEVSMTQKIPLCYELTLNPSDAELYGADKLKDSVYWILDDYSKQYETALGVLKAKLTLFRFDTKGINKLLFSILSPTAMSINENKPKVNPNEALFRDRVSNVRNHILPVNFNAFICLVGGDVSAANIFVTTLADRLQRDKIVISISDILRDNTLLQRIISKERNKVIHLLAFDHLFSDLTDTPKILNKELSMLRNDLLLSLCKLSNTIILSVSSALILPIELSCMVDMVEVLTDINSSELKNYILQELKDLELAEISIISSFFDGLPLSFVIKEVSYIREQRDKSSLFNVVEYLDWKINFYKKTRSEFNKVEGADFKIIKPTETLDRVVLSDTNRAKLEMALSGIVNQELIYHTWGWSEIDPNVRSIINFFGPPGTGKTMCANAIANELSKKTGFEYQLLSLNYSEIESMYVGEAPKKLERVFNFAKDKRLVLFFDEADSFLGKRIQNVTHGAEQAINSLRSTMLIQLEKYRGVVIFATNLTANYDTAFKTRFLAEIEFPLPDKPTCIEIFKKNMPNKLYPFIANGKFCNSELEAIGNSLVSLSGRDIKTIIWRVLLKASQEDGATHIFTLSNFVEEATKYKEEKKATEQVMDFKKATTSITHASQELAQRLGLNPGKIEDKQQ